MRFAVVSDIHGNCSALEAVLSDIGQHRIGEVVNLGDHLSGPLEARRTADLLMQRGFVSIRGNHDRWLVEREPADMSLSDRFSHQQLDERHLNWLAGLPATTTYRGEVFLCHGTPHSDTTYWLERVTGDAVIETASLAEIEREADGISASLILCGHTHIARSVRLSDGRRIVNPGSVGCPAYEDDKPVHHVMQSGTPDACYAILEKTPAGWSTTFRQVPYNHSAMAELARHNGREDWAHGLETGWFG